MRDKTPYEAARYIVEVFIKKFNRRAGDTLRITNLMGAFTQVPWQTSDIAPGLGFAMEKGWLEDGPNDGIRLTNKGYEEFAVDLQSECNELVTLEKANGTRIENVPALITQKEIMIPNENIPVEAGDIILRLLPSKIVERFIVSDPGFYAAFEDFPAHYQIKYTRDGKKPEGFAGYNFHMSGDNARVNMNSIDNSTNTVTNTTEDLWLLAVWRG